MSAEDLDHMVSVGGQGADQTASRPRMSAKWIAGWISILAIALWLSQLNLAWVILAGVATLGWTAGNIRSRRWIPWICTVTLWLAVGTATGIQLRLRTVIGDWDSLQLRVEESSATALGDALDDLVGQGERAVEGAAEAAELMNPGPRLFTTLEQVQRSSGVSAVALFDSSGVAIAWAGEHRGAIPQDVAEGRRAYIFDEGPLYSYLYFVRGLPDGATAAATFLLESGVEAGDGLEPFADRFERRYGPMPRFWTPEMARGDAVWDWVGEEPILSVSFAELTQQSWWERIVDTGRLWVGVLGLLSLLTLSALWYRSRVAGSGVPVVIGTVALLLAPMGQIVASEELFSPSQFVLPGPFDLSLGVLLVLLVGSALWILTHTQSAPPRALRLGVAVGLGFVLFPTVLSLMGNSASDGLLTRDPTGSMWLLVATALGLAVPLYLVFRYSPGSPHFPPVFAIPGYILPGIFAIAAAVWWEPTSSLSIWLAGAWGIPTALLLGSRSEAGPRSSLKAWLTVGWLAGSVSLAFLWPLHGEAQLDRAEREVRSLGSETDPFLDFLLRQFADQARTLAVEGASGINLLYGSWVGSGMAREGYEARMTLWENGVPVSELNLSQLDSIPASARRRILASGQETVVTNFGGVDNLHYLLAARLDGQRSVSVALPPRRRIGTPTALARVLHPDQAGPTVADRSLFLVPVDSGTLSADHLAFPRPDTVQWVRTATGWRSETLIDLPEGPVHAHLDLTVPQLPMLLTRGVLLQFFILLVMGGIWLISRWVCRELSLAPLMDGRWIRSFRGRLSISLFAFFLLPTVVFGAASYSAVAREVVRSAAALAQQALDQAAGSGSLAGMAQLGSAVQTDLLRYRRGALDDATASEVIDLGLFPTWLSPEVYLGLAGGDDLEELEERSLAQTDYLVAYRRIDPSTVLAAPIPLASNEISRRQQEFRDVALLVTLFGLALSIFLSLLVGRTLSRPIDELSRAARTVGEGNFGTRLPETRNDEFGSVFTSFNRMVSGLRRARVALVQETRRTEAIVAEAAAGVVALDAEGRVELINPRASEILDATIRRGKLLVREDDEGGPVADAVTRLWRSWSDEAAAEVELDGRIIRLKLRRLAGDTGGEGAVVAVEDLTAEVSTARVLAWGEMARQVAHEIKNPLTPIKLAIQHVRRAYLDNRPDFATILDRNVEAILKEIDRLGEISRAFSRFGSPSLASGELEPIDLPEAISETLALYGGPGERVVFEAEAPSGSIPPVIARAGEIKEVLLNLLENAREAVGEDGRVVVSAGHSSTRPGWLFLAVEDNGSGIPSDELQRIFEPHFSTRSSGTGLGLAIVRRIVESWGAEIQVDSTLGRGTRMEISFRGADAGHRQTGTA